jgi:uncharacterized SAM-binding protein YcdF (DUF218 family)
MMEVKVATWILLLAGGVLLAHGPLLRAMGAFLVSAGDGNVGPADAIVPLGSIKPDRAIGAATLFHQGLASRILVPKPASSANLNGMRTMGLPMTPRQAMAVHVLERLQVPNTAIRPLSEIAVTTEQELGTVGRYARSAGYNRLILVTSWYHARRVRIIWNMEFGSRPAAIVYGLSPQIVSEENVPASGWWRSRRDRQAVAHEYLGILGLLARHPLAFLWPASE